MTIQGVKIQSFHIPKKRKTREFQHQAFIQSKLRELRGYEKHTKNN